MQDLDSKLNAIVGAALRALVETGAEDEQIGAFAATHRTKVAQILGVAEATPAGPPDLVELVRGAVKSVLSETGLTPSAPRLAAKKINVLVAGKRTTVTIDTGLFMKVAEANGGPARANALIRDLASKAPGEAPKLSGWIQERLHAIVQAAQELPASTQRH